MIVRVLILLAFVFFFVFLIVKLVRRLEAFDKKYDEVKNYINTATDPGACYGWLNDLKILAITSEHSRKIAHLEGIIKGKFHQHHEFRRG